MIGALPPLRRVSSCCGHRKNLQLMRILNMQGLRRPIAFSLFMSNILLCVLLTKVLNIIQARSQKGDGCRTAAPPPNRPFKNTQIFFFFLNSDVTLSCDFSLSRNQTLEPADDWYTKILKIEIRIILRIR